MNKTVKAVSDEPRNWESSYGPMASLTVIFSDDTKGNLNCKPEKFAERLAAFQGLTGQQVTVEDAGKFEDGNPKPFKIIDYPGKPQAQQKGSGGRSGFVPDPQRYALESATSLAQTAWRIPDGGGDHRGPLEAKEAADAMLSFVEKAAPRILQAIQSSPAAPLPGEEESHDSPSPGAGEAQPKEPPSSSPAPQGAPKLYKIKPEDCPHENLKPAPKEGFFECGDCGRAGPARYFDKVEV